MLRLRNFTMGKKLRDSDLLGPNAADRVAAIVGIMVPFVSIPDPCFSPHFRTTVGYLAVVIHLSLPELEETRFGGRIFCLSAAQGLDHRLVSLM